MTTDNMMILPIEGMSCEHCADRVTDVLEGVDGVAQATVDLDAEEATVAASDHISHSELAEAVREAGYKVLANA